MNEIISNDTVTKNELSEALFDQVGLNKREAKDMIDAFFDRIGQSLESGTEVKFQALVIFSCAINRLVLAEIQRQVKWFP